MEQNSLYIKGNWVAGLGGVLESIDPATGDKIWTGTFAATEQVNAAVTAARGAQPEWALFTIEQRIAYLERFNAIVTEQRDSLALAIAKDTGKPIWDALGEVNATLNKLKISIQAMEERCKQQHKLAGNVKAVIRHKPHGVVVVLGPFNFPVHLPNGHIMPALLAGNTVIFKPSELTPYISEMILQCWHQAKLPAGVINMLHGKADIGELLVKHQGVNGIFFTGSAAVGLKIQEILITQPQKIIALEMGGNNPLIYAGANTATTSRQQNIPITLQAAKYPENLELQRGAGEVEQRSIPQYASSETSQQQSFSSKAVGELQQSSSDKAALHNSINAAVYHTLHSAFLTAGQRCTCVRRLIVINNANGVQYVEKLIAATKNLRVGAYNENPEPFMGALISIAAAAKVYQAYQELIANGAKILVPMQKLFATDTNISAFLSPAIVDVTTVTKRNDSEIFGPLLQLVWVDDLDAAIAEANATEYGLAAGIFTEDEQVYAEFFARIKAGIVNWNRPLTGASSEAPFGGIGKSGNHRPSAYYAADYCAYPVASLEDNKLTMPESISPGLK